MGVNTGYARHNIQVDPTFAMTGGGAEVTIKGPVLNETFSVDGPFGPYWSDAAIETAREHIDAAIIAHPHTYATLTVGCKLCQGGAVRTVAMTPERIAALERGADELESEWRGTSAFEPGGDVRAHFNVLRAMLAEVQR